MPNNCGSVTDNAPDLTSENLPVEFEFDQSILVGHSAGDNGEVEGTLDVSTHCVISDQDLNSPPASVNFKGEFVFGS